MTATNKEIVQRAMATLLGTRDVTTVAGLLSDDFRHHRPDTTAARQQWPAAVRAASPARPPT